MKVVQYLSLSLLALIVACHADRAADAAAENAARAAVGAPSDVVWETTFEHQSARTCAIRIRPFLADSNVTIVARDDATWVVTGTSEDVSFVRLVKQAIDTELVSDEHRAFVHQLEHVDARQAANATRRHPDWQDDWIVIVNSTGRWNALIPRSDVEAFEAVLATIDRP